MRLRRSALFLAPAMAFALLTAGHPPVGASCMAPPPIEQAIQEGEAVFVGMVAGLRHEGRWALVQVEDIWRGPDLPDRVEVRGGPEGNVATSIDRHFELGVRYLFVASVGSGPGGSYLADNACTATTRWRDELAALRPEGARAPIPPAPGEEAGGQPNLVPVVIGAVGILVVGVLLFGVAVVVRQERREPPGPATDR